MFRSYDLEQVAERVSVKLKRDIKNWVKKGVDEMEEPLVKLTAERGNLRLTAERVAARIRWLEMRIAELDRVERDVL